MKYKRLREEKTRSALDIMFKDERKNERMLEDVGSDLTIGVPSRRVALSNG